MFPGPGPFYLVLEGEEGDEEIVFDAMPFHASVDSSKPKASMPGGYATVLAAFKDKVFSVTLGAVNRTLHIDCPTC